MKLVSWLYTVYRLVFFLPNLNLCFFPHCMFELHELFKERILLSEFIIGIIFCVLNALTGQTGGVHLVQIQETRQDFGVCSRGRKTNGNQIPQSLHLLFYP